jgi:hypothetical protein
MKTILDSNGRKSLQFRNILSQQDPAGKILSFRWKEHEKRARVSSFSRRRYQNFVGWAT